MDHTETPSSPILPSPSHQSNLSQPPGWASSIQTHLQPHLQQQSQSHSHAHQPLHPHLHPHQHHQHHHHHHPLPGFAVPVRVSSQPSLAASPLSLSHSAAHPSAPSLDRDASHPPGWAAAVEATTDAGNNGVIIKAVRSSSAPTIDSTKSSSTSSSSVTSSPTLNPISPPHSAAILPSFLPQYMASIPCNSAGTATSSFPPGWASAVAMAPGNSNAEVSSASINGNASCSPSRDSTQPSGVAVRTEDRSGPPCLRTDAGDSGATCTASASTRETGATEVGRSTEARRTRVLVAVDDSDASAEAFAYALRRLVPGDSIAAVHVLDSETEERWLYDARQRVGDDINVAVDYELDERVDALLGRFRAMAHAAGFECMRLLSRKGDCRHGILDEARLFRADMIVVGYRRRGAFSRAVLGSVSAYLLHNAPCPVLVVRGRNPEPL